MLGLPANADTYLHLAGRTGRGAAPTAEGDAVVVTLATEPELRTLRGWASGLRSALTLTPMRECVYLAPHLDA